MTLALEFADKYRLWSELVQGQSDRVFIATAEAPRIGAQVEVKLSLIGVSLQLDIRGSVIGRRNASPKFRAGVFVRFASEEIDKCRRFLGLSQSPERYSQGRRAPRARCDLPVHFEQPRLDRPGQTRNLSETGLLAMVPSPLEIGQRLRGRLELPGGSALSFVAEVSWARHERQLVGLRFVEQSPAEREHLLGVVELLMADHTAGGRPMIVVADDEPNILDFLSKSLARHGYEVRPARRGEEALDLIRELRPQLVLLDILMPGIDGVDICKLMRADVEMADIPVIFLSALDRDRLHAVADESGATDYLSKPVKMADLIAVVASYLKIKA